MYYILNFLKWLRKVWIYKICKRQTHGVRIILCNDDKVFLVKHPYDHFWVLPGGGIETYETPEDAARRELIEETPYRATGPLIKLGTYHNTTGGKNDIVHVYVVSSFEEHTQKRQLVDAMEIQRFEWCSKNSLPQVSVATQARIHELIKNEYTNTQRPWIPTK